MSMSTAPRRAPLPVVLAGGRGHGRHHLKNIRRLQDRGLVRLVGVCEPRRLSDQELDGFEAPRQSADFAALLESTGAAVAVVSTPIHTHTELALLAAERGVHILLEKPPAPSFAEFRRMADGVTAAGVACQIGFQTLGSGAVPAIRALIAEGAIGEVLGVGAAGAWVREEAYYHRAPWAGLRRLDGAEVIDGALTNPLAHAVSTALAIDGSIGVDDTAEIETELFRAYDIEADDTSCVRITTARGSRVTVAATLCAERSAEAYVVVHGERGRITCWFNRDRVLLERSGHEDVETVYGRTDLLENLVEHVTAGAPLLAPPESSGAFMRVVEAIRTSPDPAELPPGSWRVATDGGAAADGGARRRVVPGIDALVAESAETLSLYSELGAPWALTTRVVGA
ncbi:Gfo/Idh/MocA family protein [Streptomyces sp. FIT100]|uniref:Gfo/Idh/MocA family protein n=1 Tax=Streptomyces sp. FIT100 TaxID=2837956 RepID=UPI0021C69780|nr:Gfo/Idh/MocA family oxidoreductase [Streptomyces sp. FIT100]UUN30696.1 Gfo/Idh/MocA family oxidoreductase [Streptomyces sp. FIT100]